jgi:protein SCO1/2
VKALAALALVAALAGCHREPLPVLSTLPPFALTDQHGAPVTRDGLRGTVWVADFFFTRCPDVCPALTSRMAELQKTLPAGVALVSITVDPGNDTPAVLAAYAKEHGAGPGWKFVTGPRETIVGLLRDGFKVAFSDTGPAVNPITHSDRFMLVDRGGRVRATYHGLEPEAVARIPADAATLLAEPADTPVR